MSAPPRRHRFVAEFFVVMLGVLSALVLEQIVIDDLAVARETVLKRGALGQREQDVWAVLRTLESPPMPLDPTRVWRLREAIAAARNANMLSTAISQQMTARIEALLGPVPATADDALMQRAICRPLRERGVPPRTG